MFVRNQIIKRLFSTVTLNHNKQRKTVQIILSNPKKRNPLSSQTLNLLHDKLIEAEMYSSTQQAKLVILKAQGPVFSAGHDLKQLQASKNPKQIFELCGSLMLRLHSLSIPTLCVVNGIAAAAGFQLSMACDMLIATQNSSFSCPGIKWGLFCSTPGVQLIRAINSQKKANQMLLFGQSITAEQAYKYGLVNKVLENEQVLNKQIDSYIQKANHLSSDVIKLGKQTLRKQKTQSIQQAYSTANKTMQINITQKADCREGLAAFSEKRKPHFKH